MTVIVSRSTAWSGVGWRHPARGAGGQRPPRLWKPVGTPVEGQVSGDSVPEFQACYNGVKSFVRTTLQLARNSSPALLSVKSDGSTLTRESMGAPCEGRETTPQVDASELVCEDGAGASLGRAVDGERRGNPTGHGDGRMTEHRMKSARWMPWRLEPKKDVARRRNASGSRGQAVIRGYPNGATPPG